MKHIADGMFARVNRAKEDAARRTTLIEITDLTDALTKNFRERRQIDPSICPEHYEEWMPPLKNSVEIAKLNVKEGPTIKQSYMWDFNVIRADRLSYFGRGLNENTCTNVFCCPRMLPGASAVDDVRYHPQISYEVEADDEDEHEEQLAIYGDYMSHELKEYNGWRVSYRTQRPESESFEKTRRRLQQKLAAVGPHLLDRCQRRKSIVIRSAADKETREKRNSKEKVINASLKKKREGLD